MRYLLRMWMFTLKNFLCNCSYLSPESLVWITRMSRFDWLMPGFEQSIKTNFGHSNDPRSPGASVQGFLLSFSHWRQFCGPGVRPRGHNQRNSIAGLHVTSWQPCWLSTTKTFLSSGSLSPFSCKFVYCIDYLRGRHVTWLQTKNWFFWVRAGD